MTPDEERENRAIWDRLPVDMRAGRMILAVARAAGCALWFSSPTVLEIDVPRGLPRPLRAALFLYLFLNAKAVSKLLEAEWSEAAHDRA
jgi:hypothetical protein